MEIRVPAILCACRAHGETAVVARMLTAEYGMVAAYVAGGRGRVLRPLLIPGNLLQADLRSRSESQLPFAKLELLDSRGPWLNEPLPAAAIGWICAFTAIALPERQPYPPLFEALSGLISAICHAPSARGWAGALVTYEVLVLRELGYGGGGRPKGPDLADALSAFDALSLPLERYLLADRRGDVMGARAILRDRLGRMDS